MVLSNNTTSLRNKWYLLQRAFTWYCFAKQHPPTYQHAQRGGGGEGKYAKYVGGHGTSIIKGKTPPTGSHLKEEDHIKHLPEVGHAYSFVFPIGDEGGEKSIMGEKRGWFCRIMKHDG